jgi:hypothetical protein
MTSPITPYTTPLAQSAAAHHELMMTYVAAGFTRQEALQILLMVLSINLQKGDS